MWSRCSSLALGALFVLGCGAQVITGGDGSVEGDGGIHPEWDLSFHGDAGPGECGDIPCSKTTYGPPSSSFPLQSDPAPDPNQDDNGVNRDDDGNLILDSSHSSFDYLWIANSEDWGRGTVSKIDAKTVKEVARYFSVTCFSRPNGGTANCDASGAGCCSLDDYQSYVNRTAGQPAPAPQPVNLTSNSPSRTAVDIDGSLWVANRAFSLQSSVSKIANDTSQCIDRNHNGVIDTSEDANQNGVIETDCNGDHQPDNYSTVCTAGRLKEFYGVDDECILFTTNTNATAKTGRPLALGPGVTPTSPSDAWAGTYDDGKFFRIDGTSGLIVAHVQLPSGCNPYGAVVDAAGILWAPNLNDKGLCYLDAVGATHQVGYVNDLTQVHPTRGGYGIAIDRDQNIWLGGWTTRSVYRYHPNRTSFSTLGDGTYTTFSQPGVGANGGSSIGNSRGIAVDNRATNQFWVWGAFDGGWIAKINPLAMAPDVVDNSVNAGSMPAKRVAGSSTIGVGVDREQNIWGISYTGSVATRIPVDASGTMSTPSIPLNPPLGCPAGDTCTLKDNSDTTPFPYTYSDFTGFGLRNFTNPHGYYSVVIPGCGKQGTTWLRIDVRAEVPANTTLTVKARAGDTAAPDSSWGTWTHPFDPPSADLMTGTPLVPNGDGSGYLQVQFDLGNTDRLSTPKLKGFDVFYVCGTVIG